MPRLELSRVDHADLYYFFIFDLHFLFTIFVTVQINGFFSLFLIRKSKDTPQLTTSAVTIVVDYGRVRKSAPKVLLPKFKATLIRRQSGCIITINIRYHRHRVDVAPRIFRFMGIRDTVLFRLFMFHSLDAVSASVYLDSFSLLGITLVYCCSLRLIVN